MPKILLASQEPCLLDGEPSMFEPLNGEAYTAQENKRAQPLRKSCDEAVKYRSLKNHPLSKIL
jgi:hypothetical protein